MNDESANVCNNLKNDSSEEGRTGLPANRIQAKRMEADLRVEAADMRQDERHKRQVL